jgi:hypothetical protein
VIVEIYTELNVGLGAALRYGDTAATIYRGQKVSNVIFLAPTVLEIGESGSWFQVNVEVPFRWDENF